MPELPEVQTTKKALESCKDKKIINVFLNNINLRYPLLPNIKKNILDQKLIGVFRRAKYLILKFPKGFLLIHLGMSGSLEITNKKKNVQKHSHMVLDFCSDLSVRYIDPRRFGACLWLGKYPNRHKLIKNLGVEPLSDKFNFSYLKGNIKTKKQKIKAFLMEQKNIVGVGNIYATEALFFAKINPLRKANSLNRTEIQDLIFYIKKILKDAIEQGGTTLKDFKSGDNKLGYFAQSLAIYGRAFEDCIICKTKIELTKITSRATTYCPSCQK